MTSLKALDESLLNYTGMFIPVKLVVLFQNFQRYNALLYLQCTLLTVVFSRFTRYWQLHICSYAITQVIDLGL